MKTVVRSVFGLMALGLVLAALLAGGAAWWIWARAVPMDTPVVDYRVEMGSTPREMVEAMQQAGIRMPAEPFVWLARLSGRDKLLKAGSYEATRGDTAWQLIERMANGDMAYVRLTFPEGWTLARIRAALDAHPQIRHDTRDMTQAELAEALGMEGRSLEGLFYPDTYVFGPGTSDLDILRRAALSGDRVLQEAWGNRDPGLPLDDPYQALILASIVEKETGHATDRGRVASVLVNRLSKGMPLQTDPTVIYGLGSDYDGVLRKRDLVRDTPWNTYTRAGLPPTPIASPGKAALLAVLHPEQSDYLYFVSRGDGTSEFSTNLAAHNRAVNKFIRKRDQK